MIDIHCHILPGIDDGPAELKTAVKMAKQAVASGTDTIIATPHFLNMIYDVNLTDIQRATALFCEALTEYDIDLRVFSGAEIRISHDTCQLIDKGVLPSLAGTNYYLFELPEIFIKHGIIMVLRQLRDMGIIPVIAHPERNYTIMKNPGLIKEFRFEKTRFQLTGQSVSGENGKISYKIAKQMIKDGAADFIASDGHDPEFRKPCLNNVYKAVKTISNERMAKTIMIDNPVHLMQ